MRTNAGYTITDSVHVGDNRLPGASTLAAME
jgi:hypothetical protein